MRITPLAQHAHEMKRLAEMLVPYTFPQAPLETEKDIKVLKQRNIVVDGYDVVVCFSKGDYGDNFLETLQIQAEHYPFLPFNVVCKLGIQFLGDDCLALIEVVKTGRKLYVWTLGTDKVDGMRIFPDEEDAVQCSYQGLDFSSVNPDNVNFY